MFHDRKRKPCHRSKGSRVMTLPHSDPRGYLCPLASPHDHEVEVSVMVRAVVTGGGTVGVAQPGPKFPQSAGPVAGRQRTFQRSSANTVGVLPAGSARLDHGQQGLRTRPGRKRRHSKKGPDATASYYVRITDYILKTSSAPPPYC